MATRTELRAKVATRVPRSSEANFAGIVNDAFDEFLMWAGKSFVFREMQKSQTVAFAAGEYHSSLSSLTGPTGFEAKPYNIMTVTAGLTDGSQRRYLAILRPYFWLEGHYPDRARADAIQQSPLYVARHTTYLEIQAPASDAYSLYFLASHLPSRFAADSTSNPIDDLEDALVSYGVYAVYAALGQAEDADRALQRALGLFNLAVKNSTHDDARMILPDYGSLYSGVPGGYRFSLSELQDTYPGDEI